MSGSIGIHYFDFMVGNVPQITNGVEVIEKFGRDGFIRRLFGTRSTDFTLFTREHFATKAAARTAFATYTTLTVDDAQDFEKDGANYTTAPVTQDHIKVVVLDVQQDALERRSCIAGTTNRWELQLTWTLRPVRVFP